MDNYLFRVLVANHYKRFGFLVPSGNVIFQEINLDYIELQKNGRGAVRENNGLLKVSDGVFRDYNFYFIVRY